MINLYLFQFLHTIILIGLALGSVLIVVRFYFNLRRQMPGNAVRSEELKIILPLRLQAYERIILFLERISPNNLVMRLNKADLTAVQFHSLLVKTIREEFEYNLSQQLYISAKAWEMVKNAKEETIKLVNMASGKMPESANAGELVKTIFDLALESDKFHVDIAIDEIKKEVNKIYGAG
jgi:hypothetical protein